MENRKIRECLTTATRNYKTKLDERQLLQFEAYYRLLTEWNEKINLTAITDPEGVAVKHFADSIAFFECVESIPNGASLIDIGTGAGFPGVVIKIVRPDIKLTLLDSLNKRFLFLRELTDELKLDATFIQGRAEEYGRNPELRENFDFAVSRAVARLNVLSEYCIPFVKLSGSFIAFKGGDCGSELSEASKAIKTLGGKLIKAHELELPLNGGSRSLIEIKKIKPTPEAYPRSNGKIKAKPL